MGWSRPSFAAGLFLTGGESEVNKMKDKLRAVTVSKGQQPGPSTVENFHYNFPKIKTPPDHSQFQQATKIIDESDEMMAELNDDPPNELFNLEAMDLMHSLETYFRMMKPERVEALKEKTIKKNMDRGYYGD